jgi:preprotein translocase subunit SecF
MQLLKNVNVDRIGKKTIFIAISLVLFVASVASLVLKGGPRDGIDFSGGNASLRQVSRETTSRRHSGGAETTRIGRKVDPPLRPEADHEVIISLHQRFTESRTRLD